jgi:hypothetical protein
VILLDFLDRYGRVVVPGDRYKTAALIPAQEHQALALLPALKIDEKRSIVFHKTPPRVREKQQIQLLRLWVTFDMPIPVLECGMGRISSAH